MRRSAVVAGIVLSLACGGERPTVHIGAKSFAEQRVLTQMVARLLRDSGARVKVETCGDTFSCQQRLRSGSIDLMVEYSGTGYLYSGAVGDGDTDVASVRELYRPLGLRWLEPLGFDNGYVLVMRHADADRLGIDSIEDLADHPRTLRFAIPQTYLTRPSDGYGALLQRHGIVERTMALVTNDTKKRIEALENGEVDVAVAYRTDGELVAPNLFELEDSLSFFPDYQAAIVVRQAFADEHPAWIEGLGVLDGKLSADVMRRLNRQTSVLGIAAKKAANEFLASIGVGSRDTDAPGRSLVIALPARDHLGRETEVALRMLRQVFPQRTLKLLLTDSPIRAVDTGKTRLALVGAERLFVRKGRRIERVDQVEAIAVASQRFVHVVRRRGDTSHPLSGKIGVGPAGSANAQVGRALLQAGGNAPALSAPLSSLAARVSDGRLDGALYLSAPGDELIVDALRAGDLELAQLEDAAVRGQLPHLRPARLPPATYSGQADPVDTVAAQVVIVGPAPQHLADKQPTPFTTMVGRSDPLNIAEAKELTRASESQQLPDAALPSVWSRLNDAPTAPSPSVGPVLDTALNLIVFTFVGWLVIITFRREPRRSP